MWKKRRARIPRINSRRRTSTSGWVNHYGCERRLSGNGTGQRGGLIIIYLYLFFTDRFLDR